MNDYVTCTPYITHRTLTIAYRILYNVIVYCTPCTKYIIIHLILFNIYILYPVQCTLYNIRWIIMYSARCTMYVIEYTRCTMYIVHLLWIMYDVRCAILMNNVRCVMYDVWYITYIQYTMCDGQCVMYNNDIRL